MAQRHVALLPADVRTVRLEAGAVVTPLARDDLKRRGIRVRLVSSGELAGGRSRHWGLAIDPAFGLSDPLRRSLMADAATWLDLGEDPEFPAVWVAEAPARAAVAITPQAHRVGWLACQVPGVRATTASDPDTWPGRPSSLPPIFL